MKQILLALTFFIATHTFSQQKESFSFFTSDINLTFKVNENFEFGNSDEPFLVPSAALIHLGYGYEFNKRFAVSFNTGVDLHFSYSIFAIPTYVGLQYNLWARDDDAFFVRANFGRLWRTAKRFSDGDYRAFGFGWRAESASRWRPTVKLMYHRKKIKNFENGNLDSVSLGIGFVLF